MNAPLSSRRGFLFFSVVCSGLLAAVSGCTNSTPENEQPYAASGGGALNQEAPQEQIRPSDLGFGGGRPMEVGHSNPGMDRSGLPNPSHSANNHSTVPTIPMPSDVPLPDGTNSGSIPNLAGGAPLPGAPMPGAPGSGMPGTPQESVVAPYEISGGDQSIAANPNAKQAPVPQLKADLAPSELVKVLGSADQDMQLIFSGRAGIKDEKEARQLLFQIVSMKLEASRRLLKHEDSTAQQKSEGARGELQSLSHFASLGDLKAAQELEKLAEANLESSDPDVVADSRLVLVGFAIESLQNGKDGSVERILNYTNQIARSSSKPDVSAMVILGEARHVLDSYGHEDEARKVRDTIIDLFGDSPSPEIAEMAAKLAGTVRFDAIEKLRVVVLEGEPISANRWRESVETLIAESADLQTVRYLSGAALDFESIGNDELVAVTHEILASHFTEEGAATATEVRLAIESRKARQDVIGRPFDFELPGLQGRSLSIKDYQGKVVLMPFWASAFPESLKIIGLLNEVRKLDPEKIEIVGLNLDSAETQMEKFLQVNQLTFPSFRSATSGNVANPIAVEFGMVSMPFVAVLDPTGKVAEISFYGRNLEATVKSLLSN